MPRAPDRIKGIGQRYVEEMQYADPKPELGNQLANAVRSALGNPPLKPMPIGHARVRLRWVNPDGTPKFPQDEQRRDDGRDDGST